MKHTEKIAALIVTYNPKINRLIDNINGIKRQVDSILIVDNGSINAEEIKNNIKDKGVAILDEKDNVGLGKALNDGMKILHMEHYDWVLTLDQDTICPSGLIEEATKYFKYKKIGILCPQVKYVGWSKNANVSIEETSILKACMTSGSISRVSSWQKVGGFDERFFIDYVDNDFCMKLKIAGYQIVRLNRVTMSHELGISREKKIGLITIRYSHHVPWRYYYMMRNNLYFIKKYRAFLNVVKENIKVIYFFAMAIIFEKEKMKVWKYGIMGLRDGKKGILGKKFFE